MNSISNQENAMAICFSQYKRGEMIVEFNKQLNIQHGSNNRFTM